MVFAAADSDRVFWLPDADGARAMADELKHAILLTVVGVTELAVVRASPGLIIFCP